MKAVAIASTTVRGVSKLDKEYGGDWSAYGFRKTSFSNSMTSLPLSFITSEAARLPDCTAPLKYPAQCVDVSVPHQ